MQESQNFWINNLKFQMQMIPVEYFLIFAFIPTPL